MKKNNYLEKLYNSNKTLIIYKVDQGYDLYTDFSEKVILSNKNIKIKADTLCIHGDNQNSLNAVKAVSEMLKKENIQMHPPSL